MYSRAGGDGYLAVFENRMGQEMVDSGREGMNQLDTGTVSSHRRGTPGNAVRYTYLAESSIFGRLVKVTRMVALRAYSQRRVSLSIANLAGA